MDEQTAQQDLTELVTIHQAKLGAGGFFTAIPDVGAPPSGDGTGLISKRPWLDPPLGFYPFDEQNGIALPAISPNFSVVLEFRVPNGSDGVIKFISNNITGGGFTPFSGDIIWQILADGRAIRNFENIRAEKGTVEAGRAISPIRIYSNQLIQYVVSHVANVALAGQVICSCNGYYYPSQS